MFYLPSYKNFSPIKNFLFLCLVLGVSYVSVWFFGKKPWLADFPIILIGILALLYLRSWKLLFVYILFSFLGTGLEMFFIAKGFWSYGTNSFMSVPLYLPFIWGNISILCIGIFKGSILVFGNRIRHNPPRFSQVCIATAIGIIGLSLSVLILSDHPWILVLALLCIDVIYVYYMQSVPLALAGICSLLGGTVGDLSCVWLGIWSYSATAKIAGIPPYIFIGWDIMGLLIVGTYIALDAQDSPLSHWMNKKNITSDSKF